MKVKRILSLVLALAMVFALAAPAFAADDEAQPCASCTHGRVQSTQTPLDNGHYARVESCSYKNSVHNHYVQLFNFHEQCLICGTVLRNENRNVSTCPYA